MPFINGKEWGEWQSKQEGTIRLFGAYSQFCLKAGILFHSSCLNSFGCGIVNWKAKWYSLQLDLEKKNKQVLAGNLSY